MKRYVIVLGAILAIAMLFNFAVAEPGLVDRAGERVIKTDDNGAIDNFQQDQTSDRVNVFFHMHLGSAITLTNDTALNDKVLDVQTGHGAEVGNLICLKEGTEFYQGTVLATTATSITLDMPLDYAFTTGAVCTATTGQMAVDGSSASKVFHIKPNTGTKWDINKLIFLVEGTSAMDAGKFGDQPALVNGIVVRKKDGDYQNIMNIKTNGNFATETFDVEYDPKPPAGTTAVRIQLKFQDVVVRLDGDSGEEMEVIIQDDATGVPNFITKGQGHLVVD